MSHGDHGADSYQVTLVVQRILNWSTQLDQVRALALFWEEEGLKGLTQLNKGSTFLGIPPNRRDDYGLMHLPRQEGVVYTLVVRQRLQATKQLSLN